MNIKYDTWGIYGFPPKNPSYRNIFAKQLTEAELDLHIATQTKPIGFGGRLALPSLNWAVCPPTRHVVMTDQDKKRRDDMLAILMS